MTRLAFLGTPEVAVGPLRALNDAGHVVALVVTAPDRRRGRGGALMPTPVKKCALELGIPVSSRVGDVIDAGVELGVVVAFGALIRADVLGRVPMVNLHFSLLPRWRGAAPVERAILAGDETTGVCLMALDEGLDTGPVYARVETPIFPHESADELRARLAELGTAVLLERLHGGKATLGTPAPQAGEALYAAKIDRDELRIAWQRPAVELDRLVRVGRAWTTFRGRRLIVERARVAADGAPGGDSGEPGQGDAATARGGLVPLLPGSLVGREVICGLGRLELLEVRPEGRAALPFEAWRRGARPAAGECLGV
ncbi:MAG: methionyl-tRNA formyltransferase [Acidimicrobiales bacterium]